MSKEIEFMHLLESFDPKTCTGVFVRSDQYGNVLRVNVTVSYLLAWRIKNQAKIAKNSKFINLRLFQGDRYVGTKFFATDTDPHYYSSPFQLRHYIPDEGSDIPEHYHLAAIDEFSVYNKMAKKYETISLASHKWIRHWEIPVSKTIKEIKKFRYVKPNLKALNVVESALL